MTHLTNRRGVRNIEHEVGVGGAGALHEQPHGIGRADRREVGVFFGGGERGHRHEAFTVEREPFAARRQHHHPSARADQLLDQFCGRVQHVFAVVDHQQQLLGQEKLGQGLHQRLSRPRREPECGSERTDHVVGIAYRRQLDQPGAIPEPRLQFRGDLQRQTRLADTTHSRQRHNSSLPQRVNRAFDLTLPADERAHLQRQVPRRRFQRCQRGELARQRRVHHLEHVHRPREIA